MNKFFLVSIISFIFISCSDDKNNNDEKNRLDNCSFKCILYDIEDNDSDKISELKIVYYFRSDNTYYKECATFYEDITSNSDITIEEIITEQGTYEMKYPNIIFHSNNNTKENEKGTLLNANELSVNLLRPFKYNNAIFIREQEEIDYITTKRLLP